MKRKTFDEKTDLVSTIGLGGLDSPASPDGLSQVLKGIDGLLPADTGVSDTDTLLETGRTLRRHLLVTLVDVGLDHDTDNGVLTLTHLLGQLLSDKRLVAVVLVGVAMRAVNHDDLALVLRAQSLASSLDVGAVVVGSLAATTEDDKSVLVTRSLRNSCQALLGDTQETVGVGSSTNGVNGNRQVTVRAVFVTNGETQPRSELTVQLRLGGTGTNGTKGDKVGKVLWRYCVKHLTGNGHAGAGEVGVELTGDAQALVDVVGLVKIGVVDQALPSDRCAGLFEVGTHDDAEITRQLLGEFLQTASVFNGSRRVVDGAGADNDEETVIALLNDFHGLVATRANSSNCFTGLSIVVSYILNLFSFSRIIFFSFFFFLFVLFFFFFLVSGRGVLAIGNVTHSRDLGLKELRREQRVVAQD